MTQMLHNFHYISIKAVMSSTTNLHLIIQTYYPPVTLLIEQPNSMERAEYSNCCDVSSHNCTVQCTVHFTVHCTLKFTLQCTVQCTVRIVLKMMKPLTADKRMKNEHRIFLSFFILSYCAM